MDARPSGWTIVHGGGRSLEKVALQRLPAGSLIRASTGEDAAWEDGVTVGSAAGEKASRSDEISRSIEREARGVGAEIVDRLVAGRAALAGELAETDLPHSGFIYAIVQRGVGDARVISTQFMHHHEHASVPIEHFAPLTASNKRPQDLEPPLRCLLGHKHADIAATLIGDVHLQRVDRRAR
jgi:hypothetical protein